MQTQYFINKCIKAIGGQDALLGIFSLYTQISREKNFVLADQRSQTYQVNIYRARGGRIRIEKYFDEKRIVRVLNGLSGIAKVEILSGEDYLLIESSALDQAQISEIKRAVRLYPRNFLAHADENQHTFKGLQQVNNNSVYVLELPVEKVTYHFDPNTFLCLSSVDNETNTTTYYNNYQKVNNVLTPFLEKAVQESNTQTDTIKSVEYNLNLDDRLFATHP